MSNLKTYAQQLGRLGGKARARNLSAQRLSEIGKRGAAARKARAKLKKELAEGKKTA